MLGRAGVGKTHACVAGVLQTLATSRAARDPQRVIFLVPEQASFQVERAVATQAPGGGYMHAEVLSFSRLAHRLLVDLPRVPELMPARARQLVLRRIGFDLRPALRGLRRAADTDGFYVALSRLVEECLREGVNAAQLEAAAASATGALRTKLGDLARFLNAYEQWLGPDRADAAGRLAVLRARLEQVPWLRGTRVWVDGFADFTGEELHTLIALARHAADMTVALLLDPRAPAVEQLAEPDELGLFRRPEQTYQRLRRLLQDADVAVNPPVLLTPAPAPRFVQAPQLARLEAALAIPTMAAETVAALADTAVGSGATPIPPREGLGDGRGTAERAPLSQLLPGGERRSVSGDVHLVRCATHRDEIVAGARWIREQMIAAEGRLHWRDFAVIARDLTPLAARIAEIFQAYEIPYFLDRRRALKTHPLMRLLPLLLDVATSDFAPQTTLRLLRTGLLPLSRAASERLAQCVARELVRGAAAWRSDGWPWPRSTRVFEVRQQLVTAIAPLQRCAADPATTGVTWATALYDALHALRVDERLSRWQQAAEAAHRWEAAELHRHAWETVCTLLEDTHTFLADAPLAVAQVRAIVVSALADVTVGMAPPTLDQVLVSSVDRSRHPDIQFAWVLAFNAGVFPAPPPTDLVLSTADREALQRAGTLPLRAARDDALGERMLAYIALTRPARQLVISYARVDDDNQELLPSPLLDDVRRAVPELQVEEPERCPAPVCVEELAAGYLAAREGRDARTWQRLEQLTAVARRDEYLGQRLTHLLRGVAYRNAPDCVPLLPCERPAGLPATAWYGSLSMVQKFIACPFQHFATHRLRLNVDQGALPAARELGNATHEVLADVVRRARAEAPQDVTALPAARWQELLDEALDTWWQKQPPELAQRRPDFAFFARDMLATLLRDLLVVHVERWRRGAFQPAFVEQEFAAQGVGGVWPALTLDLGDGGRMQLRGKIDRVDLARPAGGGSLLAVYDYKTTAHKVRGKYLTAQRLQLFAYLLAAEQAVPGTVPPEAAGVFLAPLFPDTEGMKRAAKAGAAEAELHLWRPVGALSDARARYFDQMLTEGMSAVVGMSIKSGVVKEGDVLSAATFADYVRTAAQTLTQAGAGLAEGTIAVAPLIENRTLACTRCEFRTVCRFERGLNAARVAEFALPQIGASEAEAPPDEGGEA